MNYLLHLYLSKDDPELLIGNFMGDFVKGRIPENYPPRVRQGIMLHRRIDSFAQYNPIFQQSRKRISSEYGHYRGVLVDLFYDHFLAKDWERWSSESMRSFLERGRRIVEREGIVLPDPLSKLVPIIFEELLPSYKDIHGISSALQRMSRRIRRENRIGEGAKELVLHYSGLQDDFHHFMVDVKVFVDNFLAE
jgi:acyl carrier protein phosphodiesterase